MQRFFLYMLYSYKKRNSARDENLLLNLILQLIQYEIDDNVNLPWGKWKSEKDYKEH